MRDKDYFVAVWALGHFAGIGHILEKPWITVIAYVVSVGLAVSVYRDWVAWEPEASYEP